MSLVNTLPDTGISVSVAFMSSCATGGLSLTDKIRVAVSVPPLPSLIV